MTETQYYNLKQPAPSDNYDIQDQNDNMTILDQALHAQEEALANDVVRQSEKGASNGVAPLGADGLVPLSHLPSQVKERRVVDTIAQRDAIPDKFSGLQVYVKDATADPTVKTGGADYLWDGLVWVKTGEAEGMDVVLKWENVEEKPATFPPSTHTHIFGPVTVSVPVGSWAGTGPWTQTVSVAGVTAADNGLTVCPVDVADDTAREAYKKAYACLAVEAETVEGGVKLTCRDGKPEITFDIVVKGVR